MRKFAYDVSVSVTAIVIVLGLVFGVDIATTPRHGINSDDAYSYDSGYDSSTSDNGNDSYYVLTPQQH